MDKVGNRRAQRSNMLLAAELRVGEGQARSCRVRNISATGMMGEMEWPPEQVDQISIKLGELGWIEATLAWKRPPRFGLEFTSPIDPVAARRPIGGTPKPFKPEPLDPPKRIL